MGDEINLISDEKPIKNIQNKNKYIFKLFG